PGAAKEPRKKGPNPSRGLGITVRMSFYAGSTMVRIEETYYQGAVAGWSATDLANTTVGKRAWMTIPLVERAEKVWVRADQKTYALDPKHVAQLEQQKRGPDRPALAYRITSGDDQVEVGERARRPFLAASTAHFYAMATIARMAEREPQG